MGRITLSEGLKEHDHLNFKHVNSVHLMSYIQRELLKIHGEYQRPPKPNAAVCVMSSQRHAISYVQRAESRLWLRTPPMLVLCRFAMSIMSSQ